MTGVTALDTSRRVELDEAAFGLGQQRQGFVELPLRFRPADRDRGGFGCASADLPAGALLGVFGDGAEPLHQSIQNAGGLQVKRHGLGEHLIDDRHHHLNPLVADAIEAALGVDDVMGPSEA